MFVIICAAVSADDVDTLSSPIPLKLPFTCTCTTVRHSHVKTTVGATQKGVKIINRGLTCKNTQESQQRWLVVFKWCSPLWTLADISNLSDWSGAVHFVTLHNTKKMSCAAICGICKQKNALQRFCDLFITNNMLN